MGKLTTLWLLVAGAASIIVLGLTIVDIVKEPWDKFIGGDTASLTFKGILKSIIDRFKIAIVVLVTIWILPPLLVTIAGAAYHAIRG